ncbi:unnamed protein product, partial [Linum tenue]
MMKRKWQWIGGFGESRRWEEGGRRFGSGQIEKKRRGYAGAELECAGGFQINTLIRCFEIAMIGLAVADDDMH